MPVLKKKKILINPIAIVPFNKTTKYFCEQTTGVEAEEGQKEHNVTCPKCGGNLSGSSICKCGECYDTLECQKCGWNDLKEFFSDISPEEVLDRLNEIPFENSELEAA